MSESRPVIQINITSRIAYDIIINIDDSDKNIKVNKTETPVIVSALPTTPVTLANLFDV
jgi:hypothetical protein